MLYSVSICAILFSLAGMKTGVALTIWVILTSWNPYGADGFTAAGGVAGAFSSSSLNFLASASSITLKAIFNDY